MIKIRKKYLTVYKYQMVIFSIFFFLLFSLISCSKNNSVKMVNMDNVLDGKCILFEKKIKINNKKYKDAIGFYGNNFITYELNGEYSSFDSTILANAQQMNLLICADGKEIYSLIDFDDSISGETISLDITGVRTLEITTFSSYSDKLFFINSYFTKASTNYIFNKYKFQHLCDTSLKDYSGYDSASFANTNGHLYPSTYNFYASQNGYAIFELNQTYNKLLGKIIPPDSGNASISLNIYSDEQEIFSLSGITSSSQPFDLNLDVAETTNLKIITSADGMYEEPPTVLKLVDDVLVSKEISYAQGDPYSEVKNITIEKNEHIILMTIVMSLISLLCWVIPYLLLGGELEDVIEFILFVIGECFSLFIAFLTLGIIYPGHDTISDYDTPIENEFLVINDQEFRIYKDSDYSAHYFDENDNYKSLIFNEFSNSYCNSDGYYNKLGNKYYKQ